MLPTKRLKQNPLVIVFVSFLIIVLTCMSFSQEKQTKKKKEKDLPVQKKISEEIVVVGKLPKELPVSTVTLLDSEKIELMKPLDLSEAIKYAPGVTVTFGDKSVYTLKLRGMDAKRIALLIDGIPVYEPYFSSFDLKTVATGGIDSLKITKGPSSVLYGPNTLGGIVNVITRRPSQKPTLFLNTTYGEKNTRSLSMDSSLQWKRLAFTGTMLYQDSDGFYYPGENDGRTERSNSDYQRYNLNAKLYYTPSSSTEILLNGGVFKSNYTMPPALEVSKPRYWRFKNWDRYALNTGGFTALGEKSFLRFRAYFVHYDNTLDQFADEEMTIRKFESTYDNSVYGFFALGDFSIGRDNSLKASINYKRDDVRIQDDIGEPWDEFNQGTFSLGIEDHFTFFENWKLVGGLSFDFLDKFIGENTSKVNPLVGIKFSPIEPMDIHLSFSKKSKFPSMRSMYSHTSGNPDLLSESGQNWEFGFTYNKEFLLTSSLFFTRFKDMIDSVKLPDSTRRYFNISKAYINGFEMQFQKSLKALSTTFNYTYLDHKNESDDRPLDALPKHNLNFNIKIFPLNGFRIGLLGLLASSSKWFDYKSNELLDIPYYFNLDSVLSYQMKRFELFLKISNIFNHYFYTEPGFPWRGRYFELGFKMSLLK